MINFDWLLMSKSTQSPLFSPVRLGALELANRVIMAPLTRNRAVAGQVPSPLAAEYYGQRATAGLIVAEGTQISPLGQGYLDTPGIYARNKSRAGAPSLTKCIAAAADRAAAVARWPRLAHQCAAAGRSAGCAQRHSRRRQDFHQEWIRGRVRAARAGIG